MPAAQPTPTCTATSRPHLALALALGAALGLSGCGGSPATAPTATAPATASTTTTPSASTSASTAAATSSAGAQSPAPTGGGTPSPSVVATGAKTAQTPASSGRATVPVYLVAADRPGTPPRLRLFRQYLPATIASGSTGAAATAEAAVATAMTGRPGWTNVWGERHVTDVRVTPTRISITLDDGPVRQVSAEEARLGVASLVWTATAAAKSNVPVTITGGSGGRVLGTLKSGGTWRRASGVAATTELATFWIDQPGAGATVGAGPLTVTGQACVFEGAFAWTLTKAGATVRSGHAQATSGCPERGTWSVPLGRLAAGTYQLRVYAGSMEGSAGLQGEARTTFTVR